MEKYSTLIWNIIHENRNYRSIRLKVKHKKFCLQTFPDYIHTHFGNKVKKYIEICLLGQHIGLTIQSLSHV